MWDFDRLSRPYIWQELLQVTDFFFFWLAIICRWVSKRERVRGRGVFDLISCLIFLMKLVRVMKKLEMGCGA